MNLAVLLGASAIILLGYDMKFGSSGRKHWHPDHAGRNPTEGQLRGWAENFRSTLSDLAMARVDVINATTDTALECFPRARLEDVL